MVVCLVETRGVSCLFGVKFLCVGCVVVDRSRVGVLGRSWDR